MLSPFISGKTSREPWQGLEKGGGRGSSQPKGPLLCSRVGAGCEGPGGLPEAYTRLGLPGLTEDLHAGPGDSHRRPSPQCLPHPHRPPPFFLAVPHMRPSRGLTPHKEEAGLVARSPLVPTQSVGLDPLTHSSLPKASQNPARSKLGPCLSFQGQQRLRPNLDEKE